MPLTKRDKLNLEATLNSELNSKLKSNSNWTQYAIVHYRPSISCCIYCLSRPQFVIDNTGKYVIYNLRQIRRKLCKLSRRLGATSVWQCHLPKFVQAMQVPFSLSLCLFLCLFVCFSHVVTPSKPMTSTDTNPAKLKVKQNCLLLPHFLAGLHALSPSFSVSFYCSILITLLLHLYLYLFLCPLSL